MNTKMRMLAAAVLVVIAPLATAQVTTGTTTEPSKGQVLVATKIASNFTNLAGSEENALALVNALRKGTDATLTTTTAGTGGTTTVSTITVPTKPMGWGNVKHALALAQDQLARAGITNPTAAQLQTALNGGTLTVTRADGTTTTTTVKGILTMRADGMGWGNIAKEGGTKLGHVDKVDMSAKGVKGTTATTTTTASPTTTKSGVTTAAGGSAAKGPPKGVTTAGGASGSHASKGVVTAGGGGSGSHGNAYGKGIVTGAGGSGGNVAATSHGKPAHAGGAGVVTGGGNPAGTGVTNAGSNSGGQGKGGGNGKGKGG